MNSITNPMTPPTTGSAASAFGMPISGISFGRTSACTTGVATSVVRDRMTAVDVVAVKGADQGIALGYFPGTSAWRPPNC